MAFKVTNKTVKCLVIYTYIGHDKIENWMKVYHDIETLFESLKKEN